MTGTRERPILPRLLDLTSGAMSLGGALACLSLVVLVNLDILMRFLFDAPMEGVPEIVALFIVGIAFLQLPGCIIGGSMTRSDLFVQTLRRRSPRVGRTLDAAMCLLGVVPLVVIAWHMTPRAIGQYQTGDYIGTVGLFTFPSWPVSFFIALGCAVGAVQLVRLARRQLRPDPAGHVTPAGDWTE